MRLLHLIFIALAALFPYVGNAEQVALAVASSFAETAEEIRKSFEAQTGHTVWIASASTGKLYAQIVNGVPVDMLLAADAERPRLLEESGVGVAGTRFTFAIGGLVLWSRDAAMLGNNCEEALANLGQRHLAIANPLTAPYGVAAQQYLKAAGFWRLVEPRLVYGENISQTLHFVVSGNAEFGLIARAQSTYSRLPEPSCTWEVPGHMHETIEHQAILLQRSAESQAAKEFLAYLAGPEARMIIDAHGYSVPK